MTLRELIRRHRRLLLLWMVIVAIALVIANVWHPAFLTGFLAGTFIAWLMAVWVVGTMDNESHGKD